MNNKESAISTKELWSRLFQAQTVDAFIFENGYALEMPAFSDYITELCRIKGEKPERIIKRGNIETSFGHRLFSGSRNPSRDTALQLAFGLELGTEETQRLLTIARVAALHPKIKRDAVIAYCLSRHKTFTYTQQALLEYGLPIIGGANNGK